MNKDYITQLLLLSIAIFLMVISFKLDDVKKSFDNIELNSYDTVNRLDLIRLDINKKKEGIRYKELMDDITEVEQNIKDLGIPVK